MDRNGFSICHQMERSDTVELHQDVAQKKSELGPLSTWNYLFRLLFAAAPLA
jgi:hypothetical protein